MHLQGCLCSDRQQVTSGCVFYWFVCCFGGILRTIDHSLIILSNAQSLRNKMDKLQENVWFQHEFRDACLLVFTETWLSERELDTDVAIDGFGILVCLNQAAGGTGTLHGRGVCLYVTEWYCKNVLVRERVCTKDVELLSVSLHREFPKYSSEWYTSIPERG